MKTVSIIVPTYNEEENIIDLYSRTSAVMQELEGYIYEIIFVDDGSTDNSRNIIEDLCKEDDHVKAIFSSRNFGYSKTIFYGLQQSQGDCAILLHADLQNPPELIPLFVKHWESGYKIVLGVKSKSEENKIMFYFRRCYYRLMNHISDIEHISQATDFELIDRSFLDILRSVHINNPYLRGLIMEYGFDIIQVKYTQEKRAKGKTHFNLYKYYDFAMLGITSNSKKIVRLITLLGAILFMTSFVLLLLYIITQITNSAIWGQFINKIVLCVLLFTSSLQLLFIGILGEYVLSIKNNLIQKPMVTEAKRVNFTETIKGDDYG